METLYFACLLIAGSCLALVGTVVVSFYLGHFAFIGLFVTVIVGMLIAARFIDFRVVFDTDAAYEARRVHREDRRSREWQTEERFSVWGRKRSILWCHRENPLYPIHVMLKPETMADLTLTVDREAEIVDWCDVQGIDVKRFSYTAHQTQYDELLSEVIRQHAMVPPQMRPSFGYTQRLKDIEHLAPKPYLAFRNEDAAFAFRMRWV